MLGWVKPFTDPIPITPIIKAVLTLAPWLHADFCEIKIFKCLCVWSESVPLELFNWAKLWPVCHYSCGSYRDWEGDVASMSV